MRDAGCLSIAVEQLLEGTFIWHLSSKEIPWPNGTVFVHKESETLKYNVSK